MKNQNLKTLALNKSKISSLIDSQVKGGTGIPTSTELSIMACTLRCGGNTGPKPSGTPNCKKK